MTTESTASLKVDLATEPDFRLGELELSPSLCRARGPGFDRRVEPRVMEVLVVLTRAEGRVVTRDQLIEAGWQGRVVSDDAVTRCIVKVRELARGLTPAPFAVETIPKVGFRLVAEGHVERQVADGSVASSRRPRIPRRAGLGLLVATLVLATLGGWLLWRASPRGLGGSGQSGRVEVMHFKALQADPALERLSAALGNAVVRTLTSSGIDTGARPQPGRADGGRRADSEIRVVGAVDREGVDYVVNAQFIDRRTGVVLWSGRYSRPASEAASFHEAAANRLGDILHCALTHRADSNRRVESEVFGLLLSACEARRNINTPNRFQLLEVTRRFVRAAPDLSIAHSMHALAYALVANDQAGADEAGRLRGLARASAKRALELDPRNGEAYFALATNHGVVGQWENRERDFLRAAELSPNLSVVRNHYEAVLREVGRRQAALAVNYQSVASDPFSPFQVSSLAALLAAAGDLERAEALIARIALLDPERAQQRRLQVAIWWTDPALARTQLAALRPKRMSDDHFACFDAHLARVSRPAGGAPADLPATCDGVQPDMRIRMLAREGNLDRAFAEFAALPRAQAQTALLFLPEMKAFRRDARFMPLAARLGLVDYWRRTGNWPDFCAEPDLPYDCRRAAAAAGAQSSGGRGPGRVPAS